ncbi:MAG: hypothetical protein IPK26_20440 [Planctomycetes bacterium]|nr:hypothetical protein [Planctomycetota bacterium]
MNQMRSPLCEIYAQYLEQPRSLTPIDRLSVLFHAKDCEVCLAVARAQAARAEAVATAAITAAQRDPADEAPPDDEDTLRWPPDDVAASKYELLELGAGGLGPQGPGSQQQPLHQRYFTIAIALASSLAVDLWQRIEPVIARAPGGMQLPRLDPVEAPPPAPATGHAVCIRLHARNGAQDRGIYLVRVPFAHAHVVELVLRELLRNDVRLQDSLDKVRQFGAVIDHRPPAA